METTPTRPRKKGTIRANQIIYWTATHWGRVILIFLVLFVGLPFLAPVLMWLGWENAGNLLYLLYIPLCHQMPQRSFFFFGDQFMYPLETIQRAWVNTDNPMILRQFVGNPDLGWKVAWSDRMVAMYGAPLFIGLGMWAGRKRMKPLPLWGLVLFLLPMALDGGSHVISDILAGVGDGFRYHNEWLATLTNHAYAPSFYVGDAFGSFNSWMRLFSGVSFGMGLVWFALPHVEVGFADTARRIEEKFRNAGIPLTK
jgi:uncharacterized membrane protein